MVAPRRFLPSIAALIAFEGVARTGSVTAVAAELALTQSAVSRQIQALEAQLGAELFVREKKRLHLTPAGAQYADEIRDALQRIAAASLKLQANPGGGVLNLAILPTFGIRWLAPRLAEFARLHPEITVNLTTKLRPFDFATERFDAAIHFGADDWPGAGHLKLMTETVSPVGSPEFVEKAAARAPEDLLDLPLLHLATRPDAWARWFEAHGISAPPPGGMRLDQFAAMAQAAIHGLGVALMPEFLIERELEDGRLVRAAGTPTASVGAYYLVWPSAFEKHPPLVRFREWLETAAAEAVR